LGPKDTFFKKRESIIIQDKLFDLSIVKVMGILNVTPDSFHDGGLHNLAEAALLKAEQMVAEGVDIIDIGGQSTRPGAKQITADEEWQRVAAPLQAIRSKWPNLPISIDTFYAEVAERALDAGADIINDISAGSLDKKMFAAVAKLQVPYVVMHMQGTPQNMQKSPSYHVAVAEILRDLSKNIASLRSLGVNDIIVDPGFGFGKTVAHNYDILKNLSDFKILELPLLVGLSRKRMINEVLKTTPETALNGTSALHAFALERGVNILRVHDVKEAKEVVTLYQTMQNAT
jgi:dihydropteroate synthase